VYIVIWEAMITTMICICDWSEIRCQRKVCV